MLKAVPGRAEASLDLYLRTNSGLFWFVFRGVFVWHHNGVGNQKRLGVISASGDIMLLLFMIDGWKDAMLKRF